MPIDLSYDTESILKRSKLIIKKYIVIMFLNFKANS